MWQFCAILKFLAGFYNLCYYLPCYTLESNIICMIICNFDRSLKLVSAVIQHERIAIEPTVSRVERGESVNQHFPY